MYFFIKFEIIEPSLFKHEKMITQINSTKVIKEVMNIQADVMKVAMYSKKQYYVYILISNILYWTGHFEIVK